MSGTVLLLEDDPGLRDLLEAVLTDDGQDVRPCESPEQLLRVAAESPAALALVDFWGESHRALSDAEREQVTALGRAVPTIMITARAWALSETAASLGLVALVPKPFDMDDLVALVSAALDGEERVRTA